MFEIFIHPFEIKVIDHIIIACTCYRSMAEKGALPCQSINKSNYYAIALGGRSEDENQESYQNVI